MYTANFWYLRRLSPEGVSVTAIVLKRPDRFYRRNNVCGFRATGNARFFFCLLFVPNIRHVQFSRIYRSRPNFFHTDTSKNAPRAAPTGILCTIIARRGVHDAASVNYTVFVEGSPRNIATLLRLLGIRSFI